MVLLKPTRNRGIKMRVTMHMNYESKIACIVVVSSCVNPDMNRGIKMRVTMHVISTCDIACTNRLGNRLVQMHAQIDLLMHVNSKCIMSNACSIMSNA